MEIAQRAACLDDADLLLSWRNHSSIRQYSGRKQLISGDEHLKWFAARLERVLIEPFFIFVLNQKPVGMSRLDIPTGTENKYEISILVDPDQIGKGLGTRILEVTCNFVRDSHPDFSILAKVHKDNLVSLRLFASADFKSLPSVGKFLSLEKVFKPMLSTFE